MRCAANLFGLFAAALLLGATAVDQNEIDWRRRYNLYWGSGKNVSITKMFLMPKRGVSLVGDKADMPEDSYYDQQDNKVSEQENHGNFDETFPPSKIGGHDISDFTDVKDSLINLSDQITHFTRRGFRRPCLYCYAGDVDPYDYEFNPERDPRKEKQKIINVRDLILMWMLHARYKIKEAIAVRNLVKDDKRYMLGYLYHRQRMLLREIRDVYRAMAHAEQTSAREFAKLIFSYKQVVRLEVDIRDNIETIAHVIMYYEEPTRQAGMGIV